MATSFFGGSFFGGEFFNFGGGGVPTRKKRRWALIGDRLYNATEEEIADLLAIPLVMVQAQPEMTRRQVQRAKVKMKKAGIAPVVVAQPVDDDDAVVMFLWH
jgi:putative ribosome biogenesis GTPase RsgA